MTRSNSFSASHEPFRAHPALSQVNSRTTGPFHFLNPTRASYTYSQLASHPDADKHDVHFLWRSRDNRKGRHAIAARPDSSAITLDSKHVVWASSARAVGQGILRMLTQAWYWDVSWLVAVIFTLGSVVWVLNGFFVFLPDVQGGPTFATEIVYGGGITAFIGATIFEVGSVLLMLEAVNANNAGCFGWALKRAVSRDAGETEKQRLLLRPEKTHCIHHHMNEKTWLKNPDKNAYEAAGYDTKWEGKAADGEQGDSSDNDSRDPGDRKAWTWWPSWKELREHFFHELGFLACSAQMAGATIFWIAGFTSLPGINNVMSQGLLDGVYWVPQIVGGSGFIISGLLFMLETQKSWYIPALDVLGWHIGFWNLIGAFGFTLSGALGPAYANEGAQYQAALATFWGSWAFLIGSVIQWYEAMDKNPVKQKKD